MDLNRNQQFAAIAVLGLALIGLSYGMLRPALGGSSGGDIKITEPGKSPKDVNISVEDHPARDSSNPAATVLVHVAGRVKFPNVYRLAPGSRIVEAIKAAGGSLSDANLDAVNLAAKVKDGQQIYIPSRAVSRQSPVRSVGGATPGVVFSQTPNPSPSSAKLKTPGEGFVNINTADLAELQRIPCVGPVTARKIIDYRSQNGLFTSIDQLDQVKGIGPKKLEKMRAFVVL